VYIGAADGRRPDFDENFVGADFGDRDVDEFETGYGTELS